MDTLIALFGPSSCGKTQSIKMVYNKFIKSKGVKIIEEEIRNDICTIFSYKEKKIGITSQGDNKGLLEPKLEKFRKEGCNIILCASRTRGGTCDAIYKLQNEYEINWVKKSEYFSKNKEEQILLNERTANILLRVIMKAISK